MNVSAPSAVEQPAAAIAAALTKLALETEWSDVHPDDDMFNAFPLNTMPPESCELLERSSIIKLSLSKFSFDQLVYISTSIDNDASYGSNKREMIDGITQHIMERDDCNSRKPATSPTASSSVVSLSPKKSMR